MTTIRPFSTQPNKSRKRNQKKSNLKYLLTPEEMYKFSSHQLEIGIEGYEIPRKYNDFHKSVWARKREQILTAHKHIWPPEDWPKDQDDRKVKPKKRTFLDDLFKWCFSYYDKEKAENLISEKNINIKDYIKPLVLDKKKRKDYLENEKKKEEWQKSRPKYSEYMQNFVEGIADKVKQEEKEKIDPIEKIKKRYKHKPQTSRCDRISVVSEAQYLGEQYPFYYTFTREGEEEDKKKLFFPLKNYTWKKAPIWSYPKNIGPNIEFKKEQEEKFKEKMEEYMNDKDLKKEDMWINVINSFHKVNHHGELKIKFQPEYKMKETEQYVSFLEKSPKKYVGPQHYWKMPKETFSRFNKYKKPNLSSLTDDNGNKIYYMDRKKTDKRVYTAGLRRSVY